MIQPPNNKAILQAGIAHKIKITVFDHEQKCGKHSDDTVSDVLKGHETRKKKKLNAEIAALMRGEKQ